jgi:hypothetical protein
LCWSRAHTPTATKVKHGGGRGAWTSLVKTGNGETMPSVYLSKTKESRVGTETFQMLPGYIYKRNIKTPNGGTIAGNRQTPETNFLDLLFVFWWCRGFNSEHYTGQALYHLNHTPSALFFFFLL